MLEAPPEDSSENQDTMEIVIYLFLFLKQKISNFYKQKEVLLYSN
jgi:hypothetical protein